VKEIFALGAMTSILKHQIKNKIMESTKTYSHVRGRWEWRNSADQLHREDGPAIEYDNGTKHWFRNGLCHREDGPAVECADGDKYWYLNGWLHREDGPAIECDNGDKHWWINGVRIQSEEDRQRAKREKLEKEIARKENESTLI